MDADALTFLLRGGHLNMEQRREKGIWPHPPLQLRDLVRHLAGVLQQEQWFPFERRARQTGHAVYEGVIVERKAADHYVCHCRRAHPLDPGQPAQESEQVFHTPEDAARFYLQWDLHLPGDLDGWKVE